MQHMFRTRKVEVYMGLIWLLWQKKWKCHLFVKKSKENFFLLAKGVFDVKWCGESKKVGPNALRCFPFEKSGVFWKNGWLRFVAKNNKTIFFRKVPIWLKVSMVEHWDQLFWIPRIILHQKRSLPTGKNFIFNFLLKKTTLPLLSQQPWSILWFLHLHSKTRLLPAFFIFSWCLENIKNRPSLCSTRLGCARSRFSWVYHDHCGENVIFVIKIPKKIFF